MAGFERLPSGSTEKHHVTYLDPARVAWLLALTAVWLGACDASTDGCGGCSGKPDAAGLLDAGLHDAGPDGGRLDGGADAGDGGPTNEDGGTACLQTTVGIVCCGPDNPRRDCVYQGPASQIYANAWASASPTTVSDSVAGLVVDGVTALPTTCLTDCGLRHVRSRFFQSVAGPRLARADIQSAGSVADELFGVELYADLDSSAVMTIPGGAGLFLLSPFVPYRDEEICSFVFDARGPAPGFALFCFNGVGGPAVRSVPIPFDPGEPVESILGGFDNQLRRSTLVSLDTDELLLSWDNHTYWLCNEGSCLEFEPQNNYATALGPRFNSLSRVTTHYAGVENPILVAIGIQGDSAFWQLEYPGNSALVVGLGGDTTNARVLVDGVLYRHNLGEGQTSAVGSAQELGCSGSWLSQSSGHGHCLRSSEGVHAVWPVGEGVAEYFDAASIASHEFVDVAGGSARFLRFAGPAQSALVTVPLAPTPSAALDVTGTVLATVPGGPQVQGPRAPVFSVFEEFVVVDAGGATTVVPTANTSGVFGHLPSQEGGSAWW